MPDEASVRRHHAGRGRLVIGPAFADGSGDPAAVKQEDGKYYDKDGNPTYKVQSDRTVASAVIIPTAIPATAPTGKVPPMLSQWP